jgi:hypothetical protein
MTLGCGGWGGNITSDNIGPRHLLNIKRLAYEVRPAAPSGVGAGFSRPESRLPKAPVRPATEGIPAEALAARIDAFLASRGYGGADAGRTMSPPAAPAPHTAAEFVCEEDVREAMRAGRKLLIGEKTILTPSARDLGEAQKVFVHQWAVGSRQ